MKLPEIVMTPKEKAQRAALPRAVKPKRAATIVLIQGDTDNPRILMGQRGKGHDFMPSVYVFPGGRVDRADSYAPYSGELSPRTQSILQAAYAPRAAKALLLAAIRETFEETSLILGKKEKTSKTMTHTSWQEFMDKGSIPDLSGIEVFGRAITPPHRHKRFDTWFFVKHLEGNIADTADSAELLNVGWFTFDQIDALNTHRATDMMLQVLKKYLSHDTAPRKIFYSRMARGKYVMSDFPIVD